MDSVFNLLHVCSVLWSLMWALSAVTEYNLKINTPPSDSKISFSWRELHDVFDLSNTMEHRSRIYI